MIFGDRVKHVLDPLFPNQGVFNTGYTLGQLQNELERREEVIERVEKRTDHHHEQKKRYLKKAAEARNQRKLRFVTKMKESEMNKSFYAELFDNLMIQQLLLTKLVLEAKRQRIFDDPMRKLGFGVDITALDTEAVGTALEQSSIRQDEVQETIEQLEISLDSVDRDGLSLDLDDLKEEADMLSASDIDSSFDLGSDWDETIDQQIDEELDRLEDDHNGAKSEG
jgi:hypothetical protein